MERSCLRVHEFEFWEEVNQHEFGLGLGNDSNDACSTSGWTADFRAQWNYSIRIMQ